MTRTTRTLLSATTSKSSYIWSKIVLTTICCQSFHRKNIIKKHRNQGKSIQICTIFCTWKRFDDKKKGKNFLLCTTLDDIYFNRRLTTTRPTTMTKYCQNDILHVVMFISVKAIACHACIKKRFATTTNVSHKKLLWYRMVTCLECVFFVNVKVVTGFCVTLSEFTRIGVVLCLHDQRWRETLEAHLFTWTKSHEDR